MKADEIAQRLKEAREAYYNSETSLMSDGEFDGLEEQLRNLDAGHIYFSTVGTQASGEKIIHKIPMLSMGKAKTTGEAQKWVEKLKLDEKTSLLVEPKIDGLSATCLYSHGRLVHMATRGDGNIGQDVSHIAPYLKDVMEEISFTDQEVEIRGELYLPKNNIYDTGGRPLRNNCVGIINRKDDRSALHHVRFAAYQMVSPNPQVLPSTEHKKLQLLQQQGFHSVETQLIQSFEELELCYREYLDEKRDRWLYETDGLILMVNDCSLHEEIDSRWIVDHHHHYALALKPPSASAKTALVSVEWKVSRLGSLIPVAVFERIKLGGANIERASMHNGQFAKELQLLPGDTMVIERANDVIPYVRENLSRKDRKLEGFIHPLIPRSCPVCQSSLEEQGVHIKCSNLLCPERQIQQMLYWVRMSDMEQIAEGTLRQLYKANKIRKIQDLYNLKKDDFIGLEGFGEKKITNYLEQTTQSRSMTPQELISKLGIPLVQKKSLIKLGIESLQDFYDFQDDSYVIGQNILQWKSQSETMDLLEQLLSVIQLKEQTAISKGEICMTGKGPMGRKEISQLLEEQGYTVVSSVTKETVLLLTDNPLGNSTKLQKAKKYDVTISSYDSFLKNP
jgi:DNA ligase (NAD+)